MDSKGNAVERVEVEVLRPGPTDLVLLYEIEGAMERVNLPRTETPERADELWRSTCFEAFVRSPLLKPYYELNFAPSTRWAAYRFSDYRIDMESAEEIADPQFETRISMRDFELDVGLDLSLTDLPRDSNWRLALSAVIEEMDGSKSYWAWAHPAGKPDFHHPDAFACELAPI